MLRGGMRCFTEAYSASIAKAVEDIDISAARNSFSIAIPFRVSSLALWASQSSLWASFASSSAFEAIDSQWSQVSRLTSKSY